MSYNAVVLRVMIASPSDVPEERDAVEKAIHSWNDANARTKGVILQPWRWETSAVPVLGAHPQKLINGQGVDESDIVFALFAGRLGSPTPEAVSGTAEEVDRAVGLGKPVHLYFSSKPLPADIDTRQLNALRKFKQGMQDRGLLGEFGTLEQLTFEVWKAIEHDISRLDVSGRVASQEPNGVDFLVQPRQEREQSGVDSKGSPRYTTRHWIEITNRGDRDAEQVLFESAEENAGVFVMASGTPTTIHAGQLRSLPVAYSYGGSADPVLKIRWLEDGQPQERQFHIG